VKFSACVMMLLMLSSCAMFHSRETLHSNEIADYPAILYNHSLPPDEMTLRGIKLGDPESAIPIGSIENRATDGWIVCYNRARYRIENGKIATLGVWDSRIIDQLNVPLIEDIEIRFGKADKIEPVNPLLVYHYDERHMTVLWNQFETKVDAVNIWTNVPK
jgi:hypothetical protein